MIQGDNLLALKALEGEFAGKVKCVFIDPPYNTGSAFEHYDDGLEHSLWLSMMRDRLELIRRLLSEDGSLWVTIDDREMPYLRLLLDETFGRASFIAQTFGKNDILVTTTQPLATFMTMLFAMQSIRKSSRPSATEWRSTRRRVLHTETQRMTQRDLGD